MLLSPVGYFEFMGLQFFPVLSASVPTAPVSVRKRSGPDAPAFAWWQRDGLQPPPP